MGQICFQLYLLIAKDRRTIFSVSLVYSNTHKHTLIVSATLNNKSFPHRRILKITLDFCAFVHACHVHVVHSQSHTLPKFRIASPPRDDWGVAHTHTHRRKCMQIRLSHLAGAAKKSAQHISDVLAIEHNQHIRTTAVRKSTTCACMLCSSPWLIHHILCGWHWALCRTRTLYIRAHPMYGCRTARAGGFPTLLRSAEQKVVVDCMCVYVFVSFNIYMRKMKLFHVWK